MDELKHPVDDPNDVISISGETFCQLWNGRVATFVIIFFAPCVFTVQSNLTYNQV